MYIYIYHIPWSVHWYAIKSPSKINRCQSAEKYSCMFFFVDHFRSNSPWYSMIFCDIPWYSMISHHYSPLFLSCCWFYIHSLNILFIFHLYAIYPLISLVLNAAPLSSRLKEGGRQRPEEQVVAVAVGHHSDLARCPVSCENATGSRT